MVLSDPVTSSLILGSPIVPPNDVDAASSKTQENMKLRQLVCDGDAMKLRAG